MRKTRSEPAGSSIATGGVPPGRENGVRSGRMSRLDPATWAGILSIATSLLTLSGIALLDRRLVGFGAFYHLGGIDWGDLEEMGAVLALCGGGFGILVSMLLSLLGLASAIKERSARGFGLSTAGLFLIGAMILLWFVR